MSWSWEFTWEILPELAKAALVTIEATLLGSVLAMVIGLVVALLRRSHSRLVRGATIAVTEFIRRTPLLVQLYFVFFALPAYGVTLSPLVAGVLTLGFHYGTYTAEVYRAGIDSVPRGQWEAAKALNLPRRRIWSMVVLPQAIPAVIPALGNYVIGMFKETPLLSGIAVIELLNQAKLISSETYIFLEPITLVGVFFLLLSYPSAILIRRAEARISRR